MSKHPFMIFFLFLFIFPLFTFAVSSATALTLVYSGEEHGQLGLHGCGTEQIGGLAHRQTLIDDLRLKHGTVLNLHTGNLVDPANANAEWVYQIGLAALDAMQIDILCLGSNELSLSQETLAALHANHPKISFVCANLTDTCTTPYVIRDVSSISEVLNKNTRQKVAIVGLVSENHAPELPVIQLIPPQTALAELKAELVNKSDAVVVVFHATHVEAKILAKTVPWIDILIVAGDAPNDPTVPRKAAVFRGETAIVTNASQGTAVGVLEVECDTGWKPRHIFTNAYHLVSEKIAPNATLMQLLEVYETLTATTDTFNPVSAHERSVAAIHVVYFHKPGCQKCARAVKILKTLKTKYPNIVIEQRDVKTERAHLEAMGNLYEIPEIKRLTTPAVFIGNTALIGELDEQRFEETLQKYLETGVASRLTEVDTVLEVAEDDIVNRFHGFGTLTVAAAGLLDGVNPCAFATIVFFISYMNLVGRGRKEMLIAGGAFAFAVFVTYLLVGVGTLSFMNYLHQFSGVTKCVYLIAATATFAFAGLSLYDAVKAKQGTTKELVLQLPHVLKLRIHKVIREQTRMSGIVVGALVMGFVISALELVCTGQVYLPTLTFVAGIEGMRIHALVYLLLYNFMFIVPLVVVFGCIYWGTTGMQLGGVLQKHLVTVKVGIGLLLCGLGTWLVISVVP